MKVFVCWSGGKDSSLSLYKALQNKDIEIKYLLNMVNEDGVYSRSHGISSELLKLQAEAMEIPLMQRKTTWESYEEEFKKAVLDLKRDGIKAGVFGDIDLQEHRDWVERICQELKIKSILPLWKEEREKLLKEFTDARFKAIVVATNSDFLGEEWLGRQIDDKFSQDLKKIGTVDLCGENGEFHTFVYDGPIFKKRVQIFETQKILKEGFWKHWFLDIRKYKLEEKQ